MKKICAVLALVGVVWVNVGTSFAEDTGFLGRIKQELNLTKADYKQLLNRVSDTQAQLDRVSEDKVTLQEQLNNLEAQITMTSGRLLDVIKQVVEKENEIRLLFDEIESREIALEAQKAMLQDYIRVVYEEEQALLSQDGTGLDAFKMLLADGTVGDHIKQLNYLDLLNASGAQIIDRLNVINEELAARKDSLNESRIKLTLLQEQLQEEKARLELEKGSKEQLLRITQGQEKIYEKLLEKTMEEQETMVSDLKNLSSAVAFIEEKIAEEGDNFDPSKYASVLDVKTTALANFRLSDQTPGKFAWPVDPSRGISAYFRDPTYVGVFGVQHNATDIPAYQGTPVRAAADGVVYTARDNGYGYSYIILSHSGGFSSVYGHVSNILVEEGQVVPKGFVIALSGGMPGTKGAGYMTTGPHLHFEMLRNGLHVDAMEYLPLGALAEEFIRALPEKYFKAWQAAVFGKQIMR